MASDFRKSSYSSSGAQCVEVATADSVLVRDTTDGAGVTLSLPASAWKAFLETLLANGKAAKALRDNLRAFARPGIFPLSQPMKVPQAKRAGQREALGDAVVSRRHYAPDLNVRVYGTQDAPLFIASDVA